MNPLFSLLFFFKGFPGEKKNYNFEKGHFIKLDGINPVFYHCHKLGDFFFKFKTEEMNTLIEIKTR